jgi:diketogulonate reductase-like aldo/keto reductase
VLHGPSSRYDWTPGDFEAWQAMMRERDAGRAKLLGVSNMAISHLKQMAKAHAEAPAFVQNRCYARTGWDREVRAFCHDRNIIYQGFSLLTANVEVLRHPVVNKIAARLNATTIQVIFAFSRAVGMLPLTGTTDAAHMKEDLASLELTLQPDEISTIESLAG